MKWLLDLLRKVFRRGVAPSSPIPGAPPSSDAPPSSQITLPVNPEIPPDAPGSISQSWSLKVKNYDNSIRITWPSYFTDALGIREGSWCLVNGVKASYRGQDTDNNSNRPKYTLPQSLFTGCPVLCILYNRHGSAVAWFRAERLNTYGRLPK